MFRVLESQTIVPNIHFLTVEAPEVARVIQPGHFVILRAEEEGERIPLTAADWDRQQGTLSFAIMVIGHTSRKLASLKPGMSIPTVVGPLGNPIPMQNYGTVVCIGGCYGVGSIYPIVRELKNNGNRVISVIEARGSNLFYKEDRLKQTSDQVLTITRDGSRGLQGHIHGNFPKILEQVGESVNLVIVNGCNFLLKETAETTRPYGIKTLVSLNTLMIDGTGMCGVCRVTIDGKMKFACVDGPYFDGHTVDWGELLKRRSTYLKEETTQLHSSRAEKREIQKPTTKPDPVNG